MYEESFSVIITRMTREQYTEDYEDFEPEIRTWPYLLLSFLVPLIPFGLNIMLDSDGFTMTLLAEYIVSLLPLFSASLSIKDGERAWLLIVSSVLNFIFILVRWAFLKMNGVGGYPLGVPFEVAVGPGFLSLIAYAFFNKRRRSNWLGWVLISLALTSLITFFAYREGLSWTVYPFLLFILSLSIFAVTRRTESTPWYINIILVLLVLSSITLYPGLVDTYRSGDVHEGLNVTVRCFLYSFAFWYTLSFLFVFSALAGKSSYRKTVVEDEKMEECDRIVVPPQNSSPSYGYTNPPEYSRFSSEPQPQQYQSESRKPEETQPQQPAQNRVQQQGERNDKWYDFLEGGVKDNGDGRNRDRGDYQDQYRDRDREQYRDRDRDRDRDYYRDRDYDRDRDRYYDDRRYRDDRYYDERDRRDYPVRYRDERDRDYYRDRDRRYYDNDHDRDRRR